MCTVPRHFAHWCDWVVFKLIPFSYTTKSKIVSDLWIKNVCCFCVFLPSTFLCFEFHSPENYFCRVNSFRRFVIAVVCCCFSMKFISVIKTTKSNFCHCPAECICIYNRSGFAWKCFSRPWQWAIFKTININSNTHSHSYNSYIHACTNKSTLRPTWNEHIWPVCGHGNWFQLYTGTISHVLGSARLMYYSIHFYVGITICASSSTDALFRRTANNMN